jgi:hypothetical protein
MASIFTFFNLRQRIHWWNQNYPTSGVFAFQYVTFGKVLSCQKEEGGGTLVFQHLRYFRDQPLWLVRVPNTKVLAEVMILSQLKIFRTIWRQYRNDLWKIEMAVFWDVATCRLIESDRRFRNIYWHTYRPDNGGSKHFWKSLNFYKTTHCNVLADSCVHTRHR